jgi:hypothetical protein
MHDTLPINNTDVPEPYVGAWRKRSDTERAVWLQSHRLHASLSVPVYRPDFSGRQSWADFDDVELMLLAHQGGVAGACIAQADILHRRRQIDYLPRRGEPYLRRMRRDGLQLTDTTLDSRDTCVWELLSDAQPEIVALRFQDAGIGQDGDDQHKGYLLVIGNYFLFVRDRLAFTQQAESLAILAECKGLNRTQLIELLDFEISFGTRPKDDSDWLIQLSTVPYREGRALLNNSTLYRIANAAQPAPHPIRWNSKNFLRYWSLDEWQKI